MKKYANALLSLHIFIMGLIILTKATITGSIGAFISIPIAIVIVFIWSETLKKLQKNMFSKRNLQSVVSYFLIAVGIFGLISLWILTPETNRGPFGYEYKPQSYYYILIGLAGAFFLLNFSIVLRMIDKENIDGKD